MAGVQATVLVTVIVNVRVNPASPAPAVYVGVKVVAFVNDPKPLLVQRIVPFVELAPDTVAVPFEHIVWLPPALAVGNGFTFTVYVAVAVIAGVQAIVLVTVIVKVTAFPASPAAAV